MTLTVARYLVGHTSLLLRGIPGRMGRGLIYDLRFTIYAREAIVWRYESDGETSPSEWRGDGVDEWTSYQSKFLSDTRFL